MNNAINKPIDKACLVSEMKNAGSIMIVDDNPENLKFLRVLLKEQGYQAYSVLCCQLALKAAFRKPPDLILLDIRMETRQGNIP